jgi:hypothetical protein
VPGSQACRNFPICRYHAEAGRVLCCNLCGEKNGSQHSRNCARAHMISSSETDSGSANRFERVYVDRVERVMFKIPTSMKRGNRPVRYIHRYDKLLSPVAIREWEQTIAVCEYTLSEAGGHTRFTPRNPLQIHAYKYSERPAQIHYIDVHRGIPCTAFGAGDLKDLTGCDFAVMAHLLGQESVAVALRLAVLQIEMLSLEGIAFTCEGGTHRSVGCACLLAAMFHQEAHVELHTHRTIAAGRKRLAEVRE